MLATGGDCIKLWDLNDFKLQQIFPSKLGSAIHSVSWNNDGGCLGSFSSGSSEVSLRAIKDSSSLELPSIKASSVVRAVDHAHKAACYLAVAESSGRVVVWDAKQLASKKSFQLKGETLTDIAFSPSDSHLAVSSEAGEVHLLSLTSNIVTGSHRITKEQGGVQQVQYSAVRRGVLGAACWSGAVACLDCNTGKLSRLLQPHTAPCAALAFSPINDLLLVSAGYDKKLVFYNTNSLKTAQVVTCNSPLTAVAFLPGGLKVCVGTQCGEVQVHDLRSLRSPLHIWSAHSGPLTAIAPRPTATGSLRRRKAPSTSQKLNKTLPDDSPQETHTRSTNPLPIPRAEATAFAPSGLDDLSGDILSPVRDSAPTFKITDASRGHISVGSCDSNTSGAINLESAGPYSKTAGSERITGLFAGTSMERSMPLAANKDGFEVRTNKLLTSHASLNPSVDSNQEGDAEAAFDPDDILSPVRTNDDDRSTPVTPFVPHERHRVAAGGELGCSPALSSSRDDLMRSSLLRMAAGESNRNPAGVQPRGESKVSSVRVNLNSSQGLSASMSTPHQLSSSQSVSMPTPQRLSSGQSASMPTPQQLSSGYSASVSSPHRFHNAKSTTCSPQHLVGLNSAASSPQRTARGESKTTDKTPLHQHLDTPKQVTSGSELKRAGVNSAMDLNALTQDSDASRSILYDKESKLQVSPVPSIRSLSDDLFSPLRGSTSTSPPSSQLSTKKISDRIAVIEDLIKSGSPSQSVTSRRNSSHRAHITLLSPRNKENDAHKENDVHNIENDAQHKDNNAHNKENDTLNRENNAHNKENDTHNKENDAYFKESDAHNKENDAFNKEKDAYNRGNDAHNRGNDAHNRENDAHHKENDKPVISALSPSFDPPSSRNTTLNNSKLGTPRGGIRNVENFTRLADRGDLDTGLKSVSKNACLSERKSGKAPLSPPSVKRLQKNYDSIVSKIKQMELLAENNSAGATSTTNTINSTHMPGGAAMTTEESAGATGRSSTVDTAVSSQSLTLSLVRNCVADALEEFEIGVNRRFMHLHYTLLTTLVQQTREIEELHKKYSLNEDLLEENLRLQEEIRFLRANY